MTDPYGLEASGLPPEFIAKLQGLKQQQAIAQALLEQSMQAPQPGAVKGRFQGSVHPLEYLSKIVQGQVARGQLGDVDKGRADVASQQKQRVAQAMMGMQEDMTPRPVDVLAPDQQGPTRPPTPGMSFPDAYAKQIAAGTGQAIPKEFLSLQSDIYKQGVNREDQQTFLKEQRKDAAEERRFQMQMAGEQEIRRIREAEKERRITKEEADERESTLRKEMRSLGGGAAPYFQAVPTAQGVMSFNSRTGQMELKTDPNGAPIVKAADDPKRQADIAYGKSAGSESAKDDVEQHSSAIAASDNVKKIDTLLNELKSSDAITGLGAETLKNIERMKVLVSSNIKAGKKVSDTELVDVMMGSEVFPLIKTLGVGARGMDTPAEREFMKKVLTGEISLNKATLIRMAEIRRDIAQRVVGRWDTRVSKGELKRYFEATSRTQEPLGRKPASGGAPSEVPPELWNVMTPEEKAKFQ